MSLTITSAMASATTIAAAAAGAIADLSSRAGRARWPGRSRRLPSGAVAGNRSGGALSIGLVIASIAARVLSSAVVTVPP
jgi:hypothetical protein